MNDAAERAFEDDVSITQKLLEEAIGKTAPSVSRADIKYYEDIRAKIDTSAKESSHSPIGFIHD